MKKIIITRTHILNDVMKGYVTIEGTNFSCYSLEAQCVDGHRPINPQFAYALPCGEYKIRMGYYGVYPIVPKIIAPKYHSIGFIEQDSSIKVRPGCVAVGTKFLTDRILDGAEKAFLGMGEIMKKDWKAWQKDAVLIIRNAENIIIKSDEEEEEPQEDYNFLNI